jgi:hypothetical protein
MSSITGLGIRNKVGLGKSSDSPSKPKQQGSSITGLGLRNKVSSFERYDVFYIKKTYRLLVLQGVGKVMTRLCTIMPLPRCQR